VKKLNTLLIILIFLVASAILYFSRQIFFYSYNPEYYENLYYHSQWNIPQSTRGISDGELYKFVGYRLVEGENPFYINYEVPPFAKYLYGLAEKTIGNPYWVSLGFFALSCLVIYFFAKELFKNKSLSLFSVLLFITTPFVATQIKETMLDLPQMFLFFTNAWFMTRFFNRKNFRDLIFAGIFLGLATGTKIGVYTPLALLVGMIIIFLSSKKIHLPFLYLASTFAGYVISFFCYFIRHPNPFPWLRLHEKPLQFYLNSGGGNIDYLNQWKGIFLNTYKGFWSGASGTGLGDWSMILPIGVILAVVLFISSIKKKEYSWLYLSSFSFVFLIVNTLLPFWARYLMPVVPLFVLFIVFAFRKFTPIIFVLAVLNLFILIPTLNHRNLPGHTEAVARFLNTRAYRELYRSIDQDTLKNYPEDQFQRAMENFYESVKVKKIIVSITDVVDRGDIHTAKLNTKYVTDFGVLTDTQVVSFIIEHNRWKLVWKWDYLYSGYDPKGEIQVTEGPLTTAKLTRDNFVLAESGNWKAVYIIPRLMSDWGKYLSALSTLTTLENMQVDEQVKTVIPDVYPRFIGILDPSLDPDTIKNNILPGVYLIDQTFLVQKGSSASDRQMFKDILMIQKNHPEYFYQTGTVSFVSSVGQKYVLPFERLDKQGQTIIYSPSLLLEK
jgi:hypothetical protein